MTKGMNTGSHNFWFLARFSPELVEIAARAEKYFNSDPVTSLIWARQFGEYLAQLLAARSGLLVDFNENQISLLARLQRDGRYPSKVINTFHMIRRAGNRAVHQRQGAHDVALDCLRKCRDLGIWFHITFGDRYQKLGSFVIPSDDLDARDEIERLREEIEAARLATQAAIEAAAEAERRLQTEAGDRATWEALAVETEKEKNRLLLELAALQNELAELQRPATSALAMAERPEEISSSLEHLKISPQYERFEKDALLRIDDEGWRRSTTFVLRLKKLQSRFFRISVAERERLSRIAAIASKFID
jgi:type I restriction enzyme R subunit